MIVIPDAATAERYDAWSKIRADTEPERAEPLVTECVRRLTADPGGETAHVWVAGLTEMIEYLAWRPAEETRRAAVAALLAASAALGGRECAHERHPYEEGLQEVDEFDEFFPVGWYLVGESPERPPQEADLCPRNVAGVARVTADVVEPFCADGIPVVVPEEHASEVDDLKDFLHDYPNGEPGLTIESNAGGLPARPTPGALAGFVLTQHVSCWYVIHRITERSVFDGMIEGLEAAVAVLGDAESCAHEDGEHPGSDDMYYETEAELGFYLRSPGGRAQVGEWMEDQSPAWVCPRFLRGLADEALGALRPAYTALFGTRDTSGLDAEYVRPDGTLDIGKLTQVVADDQDGDVPAQNVGLWAARRHATAADPDERLVLLHLALWVASALDLPYSPGREVRALLRAVDPEPLDRDCPHGQDGHPATGMPTSWIDGEAHKAHLDHLYAPGEYPAPEDAYPADVWSCPRLLADWARESIIEMDEAYEEMDEEDGDEESTLVGH